MRVKIQFDAKLPVSFKQEGKNIIACCPILDVVSQGKSLKEAKKNLIEALHLFFITCYEHGTLDEVMKQSGFAIYSSGEVKDSPQDSIQDYIDVQIPFYTPEQPIDECHA